VGKKCRCYRLELGITLAKTLATRSKRWRELVIREVKKQARYRRGAKGKTTVHGFSEISEGGSECAERLAARNSDV